MLNKEEIKILNNHLISENFIREDYINKKFNNFNDIIALDYDKKHEIKFNLAMFIINCEEERKVLDLFYKIITLINTYE